MPADLPSLPEVSTHPAGLLSASTYRYLPGLLEIDRPGIDDRHGIPNSALIALDDATLADLSAAIERQRRFNEARRRDLRTYENIEQAMTALLAVRRSQGVADHGRAWDDALAQPHLARAKAGDVP